MQTGLGRCRPDLIKLVTADRAELEYHPAPASLSCAHQNPGLPMFLIFSASFSAAAVNPPEGWVALEGRAVRDPSIPTRGEIIEVVTEGASGESQAFSLALLDQGLSASQLTVDEQGRLNVLLTDGRLGRAIWAADSERWLLLMVDPTFARELDPDALLLSVLTPSPESVWSVEQPDLSPMSGGDDGSPWTGNSTVSEGSWVSAESVEPWAQDGALLGIWECSMLMADGPTQLKFSFEADGTVRLERSVSGRTQHTTGTWTTRAGQLRLELPGSEDAEEYTTLGGTLTFRYDRTRLTLYKQ